MPNPATAAIDTPERAGNFYEFLPVEAATILYAGTLGAINAAGNIVPAADAAGLRVLGRVEENQNSGAYGDTDNSAGAAGAFSVTLKRGTFVIANSTADPVVAADIGTFVYVEDNQTVNHAGGVNKVPAGRFLGFADGNAAVCLVDLRDRPATEGALR